MVDTGSWEIAIGQKGNSRLSDRQALESSPSFCSTPALLHSLTCFHSLLI